MSCPVPCVEILLESVPGKAAIFTSCSLPIAMVEVHRSADNNGTIITLRPNRSASWEETRLFVLVICSTTLSIGIFWTFIGAWMVLPFSGLEAALVAYLFYRVCESTYQRQVITCDAGKVTVQFGTTFPKRTWTLERERSHLAVTEPAHALDPLKLVIADSLHHIELGKFLNRDDKALALQELRKTGLQVRSYTREGSTEV
jgi:uncharacterized membrane protein